MKAVKVSDVKTGDRIRLVCGTFEVKEDPSSNCKFLEIGIGKSWLVLPKDEHVYVERCEKVDVDLAPYSVKCVLGRAAYKDRRYLDCMLLDGAGVVVGYGCSDSVSAQKGEEENLVLWAAGVLCWYGLESNSVHKFLVKTGEILDTTLPTSWVVGL